MQRAGAKPNPMGEIPKTVSQSVKSESLPVKETQIEVKPEPEIEVEEADLKVLETQQSVPYTRFKEVNEKAKNLQKQFEEREHEYQRLIKKTEEDAEIRVSARLAKERESEESDYEVDPTTRELNKLVAKIEGLEGELNTLRGESRQERMSKSLKELETEYPEADSLAVLGWAKTRYSGEPKREQLEELMALSHERQNEKIRNRLQSLIDAKKKKKVSVLPTRESGPRFKPEEQPKTVKEAFAAYQRYIAAGGE